MDFKTNAFKGNDCLLISNFSLITKLASLKKSIAILIPVPKYKDLSTKVIWNF